jgi:uncharacterized protein YjbJ (UPF0337 family)
MNRDEMEGKTKDLKGRAKESVGDLTDNERLEREGHADQAEGKVQETFGKGKRKIDEAVDDLND